MFKKKRTLPTRPQYLTPQEIIEDLSVATKDDPVFKVCEMFPGKKTKIGNLEEKDPLYEKVHKLFKLNDDLRENMKNLDDLKTTLDEKESNIVRISDELKSQALDALR